MELDDLLLDDVDALLATDTRSLLAITASAGASIRAASAVVDNSTLDAIARDGRPHSVVIAGGGGSRAAGDILAAVAGSGSPVPVFVAGGPGLPGWVGPTDLVIAVSASGATPETLAVAQEASRRGCRLLCVSDPTTPLSMIADQAVGAVSIAVGVPTVGGTWRARTLLWSLATPLILVAGRLGLVDDATSALSATADYLDKIADACSPLRDSVNNPAKRLAVDVALSLPLIWGTEDVGEIAARRFARQLAENAGLPAIVGTLPEAARTQSVLLAGPRAGGADDDDIFRDRVAQPEPQTKLRLVMMRDVPEHPETAALANAAVAVAKERRVPTVELRSEPAHALTRLAMLIGLADFASVYAGLALGIDPMAAANELDGRIR